MEATTKAPLWLFDIPKPRALLVVAHADDETIFAGGLILRSRQTGWTIICVNPQTKQRKEEFMTACQFLAKESGNSINSVPLDPVLDPDGRIDARWLVRKLRSFSTGYDFVLTHNKEGEYGHENHRRVYQCVSNSIANPNTWVFISPGSTNVNQDELRSEKPGGNFTLHLSPEIRKLKIRAFQECHRSQAERYGYDESGELRDSHLQETLIWEFESGKEEYTFYR